MDKKLAALYEDFLNSEHKGVKATRVVLALVGVAGIGVLALTMPGIFLAAGKYRLSGRYSKPQIKAAYDALRRRKLIEIIQGKDGKTKAVLTNKGEKRLKEFSIDTISIRKPAKWDKKWRLLIFDIPTKPAANNMARAALVSKIKELGFIKLQRSAWIYSYPCEDEILFIAETFNITRFIEVLTVDKLLHENIFLNRFKLHK